MRKTTMNYILKTKLKIAFIIGLSATKPTLAANDLAQISRTLN
jgi:hypothetical protein